MSDHYPKRDPFFAHKFVRLLTKSCAAQDIGLSAFSLLCVIAHQEDAARYCGPVRFWNEQLMSTLSLSPRALRDARDKAIKFGWLVYSRESDRATGRYFVTIPARFSALTDAPIEEPCAVSGESSGAVPCEVSGADLHMKVHKEVTSNRTRSAHESAPEPSPPSIPIPLPIPVPKEGRGTQVADASPATEQMQEVLSEFDSHFGTSSRMTASRIKSLKARLRDSWWCENWRSALDRGSGSAFLRGANDRGWIIDFEFFLRPDTATKILEGKYDDRQGTQQRPSNAQAREQRTSSAFDRIREAARVAASGDGSSLPAPGTRALMFREDDA